MSHDTAVYDLGVVRSDEEAPTREAAAQRVRAVPEIAIPEPGPRPLEMFVNSLELFAPGCGQLLRGRWADGLFVLSGVGFLIALGWAVLQTSWRLPETLTALGLVPQGGVYALVMLYVLLAFLHIGNVIYGPSRTEGRAHPILSGAASTLVPGWGQLLNGQTAKAAIFIFGLWAVGALWLVSAAGSDAWLVAQGGVAWPDLGVLSSNVARWIIPAVLWALSIYDAVATSRR